MHYLDYNEKIQHRTGALPLAFYAVDHSHPRYRMPMHWHREMELIRVRTGLLRLYVDETAFEMRPGDLVLIGSGVLHGGEPEDCAYDCIVFDQGMMQHVEACKQGLRPLINSIIFIQRARIACDAEFIEAIENLYAACAGGIIGDELRVVGALYTLFGTLTWRRDDVSVDMFSPQYGHKAEQLKPALEYIEAHYSQTIQLDTLARLTGMSAKYFCRFFKAIVHRSPIDYLNYYRIECASSLLSATDMTVAEIAQRCGYNDSSFFIKQFRKYKNTTPRRYRLGA